MQLKKDKKILHVASAAAKNWYEERKGGTVHAYSRGRVVLTSTTKHK